MKLCVTGVFQTYEGARHAQAALLQRGFAASDIDLPARTEGVLAGIERLVGSFFSATGDVRRTTEAQTGMPPPSGESVRIGVHVSDEVHANLAYETLREEHAMDVALRGTSWGWPAADRPLAREHSALDELGLSEFAEAMRRRAAQTGSAGEAPREPTFPDPTVAPADESMRPTSEAEATVLTSASAPGSGAVMGVHHVDIPAAPEATRPAAGAAPQIPDEFLEYEEDTPEHHRDMPPRSLH